MLRELDSEKLFEYIAHELQHIEDFTQSLTDTVDDFRDFYKYTKKKEKVSISEPIRKAYKIIDKSFKEAQIEIKIICEKDIIVPMFQGEIIQVILIILQNCQDNFIHKNIKDRKVKMIIIENDLDATLSICDNGQGITKENLDNIFIPYFTTKEKKNGTGLGLYMAQKIIYEHHDGRIDVDNSVEGACFRIVLKKEDT